MNGHDRIKEQYLKLEEKEEALKKIMTFLMAQQTMSELYLNEEKNITEMMKFIKERARNKAINNVAVIEDTEVYKWAIEYFTKSNDELGISKLITSVKSNTKSTNDDSNKNQLKLELECT